MSCFSTNLRTVDFSLKMTKLQKATVTAAQLIAFLRVYLNNRVRHQSEREKVDSRILEDALAELAVQHCAKQSALNSELQEDENKVRSAFERERVSGWKGCGMMG